MENTTNEKNTNKNTEEEIIMKKAEVDSRSKSVWNLYRVILDGLKLPPAPASINLKIEENPEDIQAVSDEDFEKVMKALRSSIGKRSITVLTLRFGLNYGVPKSVEETAKILGWPSFHVRGAEANLKYMRNVRSLSKLPSLFGFISPAELNSGNIDPDITDTQYLNIGPIPYNAMKKAGINTISDVINYPKEDWTKIEYLSSEYANEILEAMHRFGYTDFCMN